MENNYRQNIIDFSLIHLNKPYIWNTLGPEEFDNPGFTFYIFKELFSINIKKNGFGIDNTTKQMTNAIGYSRKYKENDENKEKYLKDIQPGDLVFFHTQSLDENHPTPSNRYPGYVGIYLGCKKFIHASSEEGKVTISDLTGRWLNKLIASKDIVSKFISS